MDLDVVALSRILFGFTALYHFLFVPLTLGLMAQIALMETAYVVTEKAYWRDAARFWGRFFLINFVFGIATGYPLRLQLQHNWESYSDYVHNTFQVVFGFENSILPILLGLVVLFTFGWRLKPVLHWLISAALAVMLVLQSAGILVLNAWMQNPVGTDPFDSQAPALEWAELLGNPLAQAKIAHTVGAAYVLGGLFVVAISAWYLLRKRHIDVARSSLRLGACFSFGALVITGAMGHWSGELLVHYQPMKFAAIEALWETEAPPASFNVVAWPDMTSSSNRFALRVPYLLGLIATGRLDVPIMGIRDLVGETERKIRVSLEQSAGGDEPPSAIERARRHGYAALLPQGVLPSSERIAEAAQQAVPPVPMVFSAFRIMVACWLLLAGVLAFVVLRRPEVDPDRRRRLLWLCVLALPLPWIATEAGWMVCELGRQPWTLTGILPTARSSAPIEATEVAGTLTHVLVAYVLLFPLNVALNVNCIRLGPSAGAFQWPGIRHLRLRPAALVSAVSSLVPAPIIPNPIVRFRAALSRRGIAIPGEIIADGRIHRCDAVGPNGKGDAVYLLNLSGIPAGGFRNYRDGLGWEAWQASIGRPLLHGEQVARQLKAAAILRTYEAEDAMRRADARERAAVILRGARPADSDHQYLKGKHVQQHGVWAHDDGTIIVPVRNSDGDLCSLQFLRKDAPKKFLRGGTVEGCYFAIGRPGDILCVAEDYATGSSIFEATGYAVAVAFVATNLERVARALRAKFPDVRLIICADDDISKRGNPGLTHAIKAARAVGALLAVPEFGADRPEGAANFNDMARLQGRAAVKRAVEPTGALLGLAGRQASISEATMARIAAASMPPPRSSRIPEMAAIKGTRETRRAKPTRAIQAAAA